jgi:hypothetical protein|uniref:Uncharacterized protein n=1 Tax=Zea mays TaxID=4577 RepID=C4J1E5_MAIZE|nr:unknown [Zea mays]
MLQHPMSHHEKKRQIARRMNNGQFLVVAIVLRSWTFGGCHRSTKAQTDLTKLGQGLQLRTKIG